MPMDSYPACITWEIHSLRVEGKKLLPTFPSSVEQCCVSQMLYINETL